MRCGVRHAQRAPCLATNERENAVNVVWPGNLSGYAVEARDTKGGRVFDACLTKPLELARLAEVLSRLAVVQARVLSR